MLSPETLKTGGVKTLDEFIRVMDEAYRNLRADVATNESRSLATKAEVVQARGTAINLDARLDAGGI